MTMRLSIYLDGQPLKLAHGSFPDGAVWSRISDTLPGQAELLLVQAAALSSMDDFMRLAQLMDALRHACDIRFCHLQLPWLPYARQDRHMRNGDSFALKVFAGQLNLLAFDKVFVLDPHSEAAAAAVRNMVVIPQQQCLMRSPSLTSALASGALTLVAPDAGALKKIHAVAQTTGAGEPAIMTKRRDVRTGELTGFALVAGEVAGCDLLIVDDLCDAGGTFIGSASVLRAAGARSVSLYVTHGVFSKGPGNLLTQGIERIYTTTSYASPEMQDARVELIDINSIFAA